MALSLEEVAALVLRQAVQSNIGELALNGSMLNVLMQFDGKKTLGQVAVQLNMSIKEIRPLVAKLVESKLIQRVTAPPVATVDRDFMEFLTTRISMAIGPMGSLVIEDNMEILGYAGKPLPVRQAAELVNLLSREIPREEKQMEFKQAMLKKIRDKKYL